MLSSVPLSLTGESSGLEERDLATADLAFALPIAAAESSCFSRPCAKNFFSGAAMFAGVLAPHAFPSMHRPVGLPLGASSKKMGTDENENPDAGASLAQRSALSCTM